MSVSKGKKVSLRNPFFIKLILIIRGQLSWSPVIRCQLSWSHEMKRNIKWRRHATFEGFTVISFHGQIVPSQIVPINSQIVPQNSQIVPHMKSQIC